MTKCYESYINECRDTEMVFPTKCVLSFIFLACTTHPVKKKSCGFQRYDFELLVQ